MRWGIVGTGVIAHRFAAALAKVPGARLAGVASRDSGRAAALAGRSGAAVIAGDAGELARHPDIDVVYIATPHHRHLPDCLAVIAARKPVLCEKPLGCSAREAQIIAAAAEEAGTFCMEAMWSLCLPVYREAFDRIGQGAIGQVVRVEGSFAVAERADPASRLFDPAQGGGAALDRGIYPVALATRLLGPLTLEEAWGELADTGVERNFLAVLRARNGALATVSAGIDHLAGNRLDVWGTQGRCAFAEPISCPPAYQLIRRGESGPPRAGQEGWKARLRGIGPLQRLRAAIAPGTRWIGGGFVDEINEVEACLQSGARQSSLVPLEQSIANLALIDAIRERIGVTAPQDGA